MTTKTGLSIAVPLRPPPPDTWRRRLADWLSGWSVCIRERAALRLAPWLDQGER